MTTELEIEEANVKQLDMSEIKKMCAAHKECGACYMFDGQFCTLQVPPEEWNIEEILNRLFFAGMLASWRS